jgi:drug/metabolite transporter (DMT)-like permease
MHGARTWRQAGPKSIFTSILEDNLVRWIQQHSFIFLCILFTVSSQLLMRWRVGSAGVLPDAASGRVEFIVRLLLTPWIWLAVACTFLAGVSWMLTLTRFELSYAFPFTGVSFLVMLFAGAFLFHEHVSAARVAGTLLVLLGLAIVVRS